MKSFAIALSSPLIASATAQTQSAVPVGGRLDLPATNPIGVADKSPRSFGSRHAAAPISPTVER